MTPVEHGATSSGAQPIPAASAAQDSRASLIPALPVKQLAEPELAVTACRRPRRICSWVTTTGAALTRLVVKTPAAASGRSATITPRSLRPGSLRNPAATPAKRKPLTTRGSRVRFIGTRASDGDLYAARRRRRKPCAPSRHPRTRVNVRADLDCDRDSSDFPHKEERGGLLAVAALVLLARAARTRVIASNLFGVALCRPGRSVGSGRLLGLAAVAHHDPLGTLLLFELLHALLAHSLHREDFLDHVHLHRAHQRFEHREAFLLVLDQGIQLGIATKPDAFLQMVHREQMVLPQRIERLQHHDLFDLPHHGRSELLLALVVERAHAFTGDLDQVVGMIDGVAVAALAEIEMKMELLVERVLDRLPVPFLR